MKRVRLPCGAACSATLDASSPHYADQAPLFVEPGLRTAWMDEADVRAHLEREYRPGE